MSGNVWEWCQDKYGPYPSCAEPAGTGSARVLRGGSWYFITGNVRVANRYNYTPIERNVNNGFRVAQD